MAIFELDILLEIAICNLEIYANVSGKNTFKNQPMGRGVDIAGAFALQFPFYFSLCLFEKYMVQVIDGCFDN